MVRLRLLGGASLEGPNGPIAGRSAQRRRIALLALLALGRRPLAREKLTAYLWPEADTERARRLLSESLYVIRKELGDDVLTTPGDEIALDMALVRCDVVDFEDALDRRDPQGAVALYDGPFLDGFFVSDADEFERWATGERDRLERRYREAVEFLASEAGTRGDARAAADWWRMLAARDPFDGRVARSLMESLVAAGDRAGALQHARSYETLLREELDAAPDPEMVRSVERLRDGQPMRDDRGARAAEAVGSPPAVREGLASESAGGLDAVLRSALASEFEIGRLLGAGTTARAYLARDVALDMAVTIKVLKPELASSPEARGRFEREARAAANIVHPNVSNVHRFGVLPTGEPYLVIEYVRGRTLEERLAAEGPFDAAETRRILADLASALEAAHRHGVVHRDIRPGNVLLDEQEGRAIVTDFGIAGITEAWTHGRDAKLTRTGQRLGDPRYVSPEQFRGDPVTEAADIYSMALVGYEMLTATLPHAAAGAREAAVARLTAQPIELPDSLAALDPGLADVLMRCLSADPAHRPSAKRIAQRLRLPAAADALSRAPTPPLPAWLKRSWRALYRRRIPQWVAGTAAGGWFLLEGVSQLTEQIDLPLVFYHLALASVIVAIAAAAVLAWFHGERGEQRFRAIELWILGAIVIAWIVSLVAILS